jgi:hypothetical protein
MIELFKQHNVGQVVIEFDAGGDQVNTLYVSQIFDENQNDITTPELIKEFEDLADMCFGRVDFYANSDGHYQGEYGQIIVEVITENGEEDLEFSKCSTSTYNETHEENFKADGVLTQNLIDFCKENVEEILLDSDSTKVVANYSKDIILTEEIEEILEEIFDQLDEFLTELIRKFEHEVYSYNAVYTVADNNITFYLRYEEFSDN